jgi:hypothetical protein
MLPYSIAFDDDVLFEEIDIPEIILNILLFFDIVFCFFSAYTDNEENVIKNRRVKNKIK